MSIIILLGHYLVIFWISQNSKYRAYGSLFLGLVLNCHNMDKVVRLIFIPQLFAVIANLDNCTYNLVF